MNEADWTTIQEAVRILAVPLLGYMSYILRDIREQLKKLNGRVAMVETWTVTHGQLDEERNQHLHKRIDELKTR